MNAISTLLRSRTLPACWLKLLSAYTSRSCAVSIALLASLNPPPPAVAQDATHAQYSVQRVWDEAPHNAFTDLVRFRDRFYCTFREGAGHVPSSAGTDGKVRVIASDDAEKWRSIALVAEQGIDLRDPKLSITPDGRLMLLMGGSRYDQGQLLGYSPRVSFSDASGGEFPAPTPIVLDKKIATGKDWLWRVTWREDVAYGVVYQSTGDGSTVHLVRSKDGVNFEAVADLGLTGQPNESTIRFREEEMLMVVRREGGNTYGMFGRSRPPYTEWSWREMTHRLGGPDFLVLPNGQTILGTRKHTPAGAKTMIARLADDGTVTELLELPSGGDTSYPGMLVHDGSLYVSYYSSHEGKTAIYLAIIPPARCGKHVSAKERVGTLIDNNLH
jgi:hypothetical protein